MAIKITQEVFVELELKSAQLGFDMAFQDAGYQAEFFNNLYAGLLEACGGAAKAEMQIAFIADYIDKRGKELINALYELLKLRGEQSCN